ncbi:hypothetical protein [uncultured Tateyamaria sp.]|uniref:hypothetical protein n=1 Tax=uncultured Tateyamaria sp. TaxID=455651 RepID=UPI002612BC45|nr:hypothetical protein [uncultured Tateyamaria sp.]
MKHDGIVKTLNVLAVEVLDASISDGAVCVRPCDDGDFASFYVQRVCNARRATDVFFWVCRHHDRKQMA